MSKILFLIPRMNNGGAERVIAHLANGFSQKNEVVIVTIVDNSSFYKLDNKIKLISADIKINRQNRFCRFYSICKGYLKCYKYIKQIVSIEKPNYIVSFLFEADLIAYFLSKNKRKIKWISSERADPKNRKILKQSLINNIFKKTDLLVCQNKNCYVYYKNVDNKTIIANPLDLSTLPTYVNESNDFNICGIGRLASQKNFSLLINAFALLKKEVDFPVKLTIYGEGTLRKKLEEQIEDLNMNEFIELPGKSNDILNEIKDKTLFVMSSDYEGFPNALLEAMAVGLPVISTDFPTGTARELISEKNGIIVPCNDVIAMKNAMLKILTDKELRTQMRKNNLFVREKYSVDKICKQWEDALRKI